MTRYQRSTMPKLFLVLASLAACGYATRCEAQSYMIIFTTAKQAGAGTDSNIFITLRGTTKSVKISTTDHLKNDDNGGPFEVGDVDYFVIPADVGPLKGIVVESDGKYSGPDWALASVHVIRLASEEAAQELRDSIGEEGLSTRAYVTTYAKLQADGKLAEEVDFQYNNWVTKDEPAVWKRLIK